jgi:probable O-glycosylation ligase (exosortase A-associated)
MYCTAKKRLLKVGILLMAIFSALLVVHTKSRGGIITLLVIGLFSTLSSKRPIVHTLLLIILVSVTYYLLPEHLFERLDTLQSVDEDESAMGRITMWKLAFRQALGNPLMGVGPGCFRLYNDAHFPDMPRLVTHNVYFQVLSSSGWIGLTLYLLLILGGVVELHKAYALAQANVQTVPQLEWAMKTAFWMRNSLVGYLIGSAFLDMLVYDIPWYFLLYASLFRPLVQAQIKEICLPAELNDNEKGCDWMCDHAIINTAQQS